MKKHARPSRPPRSPRAALTIVFAAASFCVLTVTMAIVGLVIFLLYRAGVFAFGASPAPIFWITAVFAISSIVIGTIVALFFSRLLMRPMNRLIGGLNQLAEGNYNARLYLGELPLWKKLADTFNRLAEELGNTEMLRSDFVNNFSHEFKTPIVSIRGFARLLKRADMPDGQRREYLDIIEEESDRLTVMATNVLDLTKVENQTILTDVTSYNLSEQLRTCVLLLEKRWTDKALSMQMDFAEYDVSANEELLKQVWINLLDNAIKFSPEGGVVEVSIRAGESGLRVAVTNEGPAIAPEDMGRIFNKFYQADASHAAQGNGLGLAIAKRIVELHSGQIAAESAGGRTLFTVTLPQKRQAQ